MRIALCLCQTSERFHPSFYNGWKTHVLDCFDTDVYINTNVDQQLITDTFHPRIIMNTSFDPDTITKEYEKCYGDMNEIIKTIYDQQQLYLEVINSGIDYDWVIMSRTDFCLDKHLPSFDSPIKIIVKSETNHVGLGYSPNFMICNLKHASAISQQFYSSIPQLYNLTNVLCPFQLSRRYLTVFHSDDHIAIDIPSHLVTAGPMSGLDDLKFGDLKPPNLDYEVKKTEIVSIDLIPWDDIKTYPPDTIKNYYQNFSASNDAEDYYCHWMIIRNEKEQADMKDDLDYTRIESRYLELSEKYPNRIDHLLDMIHVGRTAQDKFKCAEIMSNVAISLDFTPPDGKYVDRELYEWKSLDYASMEGFWAAEYEKSDRFWTIMMEQNKFPEWQRSRLTNNGVYAKDVLKKRGSYERFREQLSQVNLIRPNGPNHPDGSDLVPNILHFVWISGDRTFSMIQYLTIRAAYEVQKPDKIYMWNDHQPRDNVWWERARPYFERVKIEAPGYINGHDITHAQHRADVMRICILNKLGGTYVDMDLLLIRDFHHLRSNIMTMCIEAEDTKMWNGCIIAKPNNALLTDWINRYETGYGTVDEGCWWAGHSICLPMKLSKLYPEAVVPIPGITFLPFNLWSNELYDNDLQDPFPDSLGIHLWETEQEKRNVLPKHVDYIETKKNSFVNLFGKYFQEFIYD